MGTRGQVKWNTYSYLLWTTQIYRCYMYENEVKQKEKKNEKKIFVMHRN